MPDNVNETATKVYGSFNERFIQTILDKFEYMFYSLGFAAIYYLAAYTSEPIPEIIAHIDSKKPEIMKQLLIMVKDAPLQHVLDGVNKLKELGVNWPEFKVIDKSIAAEIKRRSEFNKSDDPLNESVHYDEQDIVNELIYNIDTAKKELIASPRSPIITTILKLTDKNVSILEMAEIFGKCKNEILSYLEYLIQRGTIWKLLTTASNLVPIIGSNTWPEINELFDSVKQKFIKEILIEIKAHRHMSAMINTQILADKIGLNWPELNVFKKSLQAIQDQHDNQSPLEEMIKRRKHRTDTFTHDDQEYDLIKLDKIIQNDPVRKFDINDLLWIFKYDNPKYDHPERIKTANLKIPIIVTRWNSKLVVLDGLHRLAKAYIKGMKVLPGRMVFRHQLKMAKAPTITLKEVNNTPESGAMYSLKFSIKNGTITDLAYNISDLEDHEKQKAIHVLNVYKHKIIKDTLAYIKRDSYHNSRKYVISTINALQDFGIDWPELNIIRKSMEAEIINRESKYELDEDEEELKYPKWSKNLHYINRIEYNLDHYDIGSALNYIFQVDFSDEERLTITKLFDDNKTKVMQTLLRYTRCGYLTEVDTIISKLHKIGIDWPELLIIKKSITAELIKKLGENTMDKVEDLNENIPSKKPRSLKNFKIYMNSEQIFSAFVELTMMPDNEKQQAIDIINTDKNKIIKNILQYIIKDSQVESQQYIVSHIDRLKNFGIDWPELDVIKKSLDNEIMKKSQINEAVIDRSQPAINMAKRLLDDGHLIKALDYLLGQGLKASKSPTLQIVLDEHKKALIRYALEKFKSTEYSETEFYIGKLIRLGLKWPEITAIAKSARFEVGREALRESFDINSELDILKIYLKNEKIADFCISVRDQKLTVQNYNGLEKLMNSFKPMIIYYILKRIKNDIAVRDQFIRMLNITKILIKTKIEWPELYTIKKSLDAHRKDINEFDRIDESSDWIDTGEYKTSVENYLKREWPQAAIARIDLNKLTIDNCPGLKEILIEYKNMLVKYILTMFQRDTADGENFTRTLQKIKTLRNAGIEWPEFKIVENSIRHQLQIRESVTKKSSRLNKLIQSDIRLDTLNDDLKRGHIMDACIYIRNFNLKYEGLEELLTFYKTKIIKEILNRLKNNSTDRYTMDYLLSSTNVLIKLGLNWPELVVIKKSLDHQKQIRESITKKSSNLSKLIRNDEILEYLDEQLEKGSILNVCTTIRHIKSPFKHKGMEELLNFYKTKMITYFLSNIKNANDDINTMYCTRNAIRTLIYIRLDWPELDVIYNSLMHEYNSLNESWSMKALDKFGNYIADDNLWDATRYMHANNLNMSDSGFKQYMEKHKKDIIKILLETIKFNITARTQLSLARQMILWLKYAHVKWLELDIMLKSLDHQRKIH